MLAGIPSAKFEPGFDAGMHTHTNDVWIVVIKGAYLYKEMRVRSALVPASSYVFPEATSIGAVETRKKARCFMKRDRGNLI